MAVYTKRIVNVIPYTASIKTTGILEPGSGTNPDTSVVSLVRLTEAAYE